ncbi:uncharacterized protein IL334_006991 [Kwoniella shivajii]|uniref:Dynactin 2 n=1 Tax=Kwoniella shivajii TaxID=564305 RepID=A0ABZ1D7G4_9TREE|nr:hypothetical protein IL334_006991 [Kwoniella shivajii]
MPAAESPLLPLDIRVRTLEAQLYGVPSSVLDHIPLEGKGQTPIPAIRRLREAEDVFERLGNESEGLKRLLEGYNQYLPLLTLSNTSTTSNAEDHGEENPVTESDLLPDQVKLVMVLEAFQDIKGAERDLREIELLKQRGAEGSGQLEELLPFKPSLIKAINENQTRSDELLKARKDVASLLTRYNDFTSTASDMFIDLHHQIRFLEDRVARLERRKKKEIEGRF